MTTGTEWLIDAVGCQPESLRDAALLAGICQRVLDDLGLHVVGSSVWHAFPGPGGVTGLYLLTESHLACHTYPEWRTATFNLYCCRERPAWPWAETLGRRLGAERVGVRRFERGTPAAAALGDAAGRCRSPISERAAP